MAMNPEVKTEWLKALRSGEYKQTKSMLHRRRGGFCCLGVLCELAVKAEVIPAPVLDDGTWRYDGELNLPSVAVYNWAGISDPGDDAKIIDDLINANDEGKRFSAIADMIEARL